MEQLINAVLTWLKGAGFQAVRRMPEGEFPELSGAVVAVGLEKAEATDAGLYSYLGVTEMDGKTVSIYGRRLEAQVAMEVVSPEEFGREGVHGGFQCASDEALRRNSGVGDFEDSYGGLPVRGGYGLLLLQDDGDGAGVCLCACQ